MNLYNLLGQHAFWMINKKIAKEIGLEASLLLSDLISKRQYFIENKDITDGWFFNTQENIELDTSLTPHQQRKAFEVLQNIGFIEVKRYGIPAKNHYSICDNKILKFLTTGSQNFEELEVKDFNNINNNKEIKIKNKNKVFIKPSLNDVKEYVTQSNYAVEIAQRFYDYYEAGNWHDQSGKPVKNWKQKLIAVWFKPDLKVKNDTNLPNNWEQMSLTQKQQWRANNGN